MAKTIFQRGRVVTSAFLNAIFAHVHDGGDEDGKAPMINLTNAAHVTGVLPLANMSPILSSPGYIDGFNMRYAFSSSADKVVVYSGYAHDSNNNKMLRLTVDVSGFYKTILNSARTEKAAWAAGNNGGVWPTTVELAEGWYHVFVLGKTSDGTAAEIGIDSSLTALNLLSSVTGNPGKLDFNLFRRVGSVLIDKKGGIGYNEWRLVPFRSHMDRFVWYSAILDVNGQPGSAIWTTRTLSVPSGVSVEAIVQYTASSASQWWHNLRDGVVPDDAANWGIAFNGPANTQVQCIVNLITNFSSQVMEYRSAGGAAFTFNTLGWIDPRGRLS